MQLPGDQYLQIGEALIDAFDVDDFARMLRVRLDVRLDTITTERADFATVVYSTLDWAERRDRVDQLVASAKEWVPTSRKLQALPVTYGEDTGAIRLTKPRADVAASLRRQIASGELLLSEGISGSQASLEEQSSRWHTWRQFSEQTLRESFAPPTPLLWLKKLVPGHLAFGEPWQIRAQALQKDVRQELAFLRNLLARLNNYPGPDSN